MLARNIRVEEDLVDQLFNSSEKRLARVLPLLSRDAKGEHPLPIPNCLKKRSRKQGAV
jgi:CRP/FNR family cyclic AMP-dependent transcriptional regulator